MSLSSRLWVWVVVGGLVAGLGAAGGALLAVPLAIPLGLYVATPDAEPVEVVPQAPAAPRQVADRRGGRERPAFDRSPNGRRPDRADRGRAGQRRERTPREPARSDREPVRSDGRRGSAREG